MKSRSQPRRGSRRRHNDPVTFQAVRELALALPEVEEGTSYGTPAFKVKGWPTILVRLARVDRDDLARLLEDSWRQNAPKRLRDRFP